MSFALANLPPVSSLSVALRTLEKDVGAVGSVILKMDKGGHWIYGAEQTEVESDSTWAVNPFSFIHGYIAWGDGEVLGEMMVPVTEPKPELPPVPHGAKKGWEVQVGMSLKCLSGPIRVWKCATRQLQWAASALSIRWAWQSPLSARQHRASPCRSYP